MGSPNNKNTGVGCHLLLQGVFLTQGSNPGLLHRRQILYCLSHQGSRATTWVQRAWGQGGARPTDTDPLATVLAAATWACPQDLAGRRGEASEAVALARPLGDVSRR